MPSVPYSPAIAFPLEDLRLQGVTPCQLFGNLKDRPNAFWLDSGCAKNGWSYIGLNPIGRMEVYENIVCTSGEVTSAEFTGERPFDSLSRDHALKMKVSPIPSAPIIRTRLNKSPMSLLANLSDRYRVPRRKDTEGPPFCGGWVGFLGYESAHSSSEMHRVNDLTVPTLSLNLFDTVLAYAHDQKKWWGGATRLTDASDQVRQNQARAKVALLAEQIQGGSFEKLHPQAGFRSAVHATSNFTRAGYEAAVARALEYIAAGDIYQINIAQRFSVPWALIPEILYENLRRESPAAYGAYLGTGLVGQGQALCSISPELFLQLRGNEVVTRPIKGTRPLGVTAGQALSARHDLESSVKERSELNMIVDLERNDLGRVCDYGSVRVLSSGEIEELPTLLHRVAVVTGRLHSRYRESDLLSAAFPGGSVTGAPKIRAMQIIEELEPCSRGPYCGAIGWIGLDGDMDLSIAIRTALYDGNKRVAHYFAGSGIVADSKPTQEYEETLHKAAAFFRATNSMLEGPG